MRFSAEARGSGWGEPFGLALNPAARECWCVRVVRVRRQQAELSLRLKGSKGGAVLRS